MVKRFFDVLFSLILLFLLSPVLLLGTAIIFLTDGRPILFTQERLGKGGKNFRIFKFRSMTNNPDRIIDHEIRSKDPELIRFGYFLRRYKIDELPQLWNILLGHMSIVGPRPVLPRYLETYSPRQRRRLEIRGGLTCLAQVNGGSYLSWDERIEYDLIYLESQNFWLDIKILLKTVFVIFFGEKYFLNHLEINHIELEKRNNS